MPSCIISGCLNSVKGLFLRYLPFYALLLPLLLAASPHARSAGQITVEEDSLADKFSPYRLPASFYTVEPSEYWAEPVDSWWLSASNWVIHQERLHGSKVQGIGNWADRTLSGSEHGLPNNESYLRLGFAAESEYSDPAQFKPEVRFRLDLPTTKKKLRLVIESDSDELVPLGERERDRQLTEPERTDTDTTGALRYLTDVGDAINLSMDVGGRLRLPPEMFWRLEADKRWLAPDKWRIGVKQRVYYYHTSGWGSRSWFGADRPAWNGWHFFTSSELEWVHSDRKFEAAQLFSLRKRTSSRSVISPRIGILGESQPLWQTTSYFADVTWRYRVYEDWLFAELIPALEFPREESFKDQASVIFRIEMYFAGTIDRD
ncbi:hypothetical protein DOQ08_01279 [Marinobacter litoralis]|uniref:Alginate export domain-containing protein n=1 Tax=Marinobacter litoralis TaxID=187981 RepID=A0A3M2RFL2_9GAMM|nr:hypothetical protein DOQ08_01279 [Marinobacter litoralis]